MKKHPFMSKVGIILPLLILCICAFGFLFAPNDPELVDLTRSSWRLVRSSPSAQTIWGAVYCPACSMAGGRPWGLSWSALLRFPFLEH